VLPYLVEREPWGLDLRLAVRWNGTVVSRPPFRTMYWSPAQQLAHLTVNGASLRTGDLYASGTVSGPDDGEEGSFIELSRNGGRPVTFPDGSERTFLLDGDVVQLEGTARAADGEPITLGEVTGRVQPARPDN
jgi:fumarylacetoacetase